MNDINVKPNGYISVNDMDRAISEEFKGITADIPVMFPKGLGAKHPFNFQDAEKLYIKYGLICGLINKLTDSTITEFEIKLKNPNAQAIINSFIKDSTLIQKLRDWVREGYLKGNGFMEIDLKENKVRVMNSNHMYVKRNKRGKILEYTQWTRDLKFFDRDSPDIVIFKPNEIAHLTINKIPNDPYGIGVVYPNERVIENLVKNEQDQQKIITRKAGHPYHIKVGQPGANVPSSVVDSVRNNLTYLTNTHEWVTDGDVEIKSIDFGNLGNGITEPQMYFYRMLLAGFEVPEVLMGSGQLNEGIAKVQIETFKRKIVSIQNQISDIIEEKVIRPILNANDLDESPEFVWQLPTEEDINNRILRIKELMMVVSPTLKAGLEIELAKLLGLDELEKDLPTPEEARDMDIEDREREQEENLPQPEVPTAKKSAVEFLQEFIKKEGNEYCVISHTTGKTLSCYSTKEEAEKALERMKRFKDNSNINLQESEDMDLKTWINIKEIQGFNYTDYLVEILKIIKSDNFKDLAGKVEEDYQNGLLTPTEIAKLRLILRDGFRKNLSVREIENNLKEEINFKDRITSTGTTPAVSRPNTIARTETVRLANEGLKELYKVNGIEKVRWLSAISDRTCPICEALNGQVFNINEINIGNGQPPAHSNCRCSLISV